MIGVVRTVFERYGSAGSGQSDLMQTIERDAAGQLYLVTAECVGDFWQDVREERISDDEADSMLPGVMY